MQYSSPKHYSLQQNSIRSYIPKPYCIKPTAWTTYIHQQNRIPLYSAQLKDSQQSGSTFTDTKQNSIQCKNHQSLIPDTFIQSHHIELSPIVSLTIPTDTTQNPPRRREINFIRYNFTRKNRGGKTFGRVSVNLIQYRREENLFSPMILY